MTVITIITMMWAMIMITIRFEFNQHVTDQLLVPLYHEGIS